MAKWRKGRKALRSDREKAPTEGDARSDFVYQNGYTMTVINMGDHWVKLQLESDVDCAAILVPPEERTRLGNWLIAGMQCG